jgi:hypothetical protein
MTADIGRQEKLFLMKKRAEKWVSIFISNFELLS